MVLAFTTTCLQRLVVETGAELYVLSQGWQRMEVTRQAKPKII